MKNIFLLGAEIAVRYFLAFVVGLVFMQMTGRFMNHLNMTGSILFPNLALLMFIQVPIWMLLARLLTRKISFTMAEISSAALVGLIAAQPWYFPRYWHYVRLPTVDAGTKNEMMVWYVAWTSNFTMAIFTAFLFISITWIFKKK